MFSVQRVYRSITVHEQYLLKGMLQREARLRESVCVGVGEPIVVEEREPNWAAG
jgi:hypothetical protein